MLFSPKDDIKSLRKDKAQPKWANKDKRKSEKTTSSGAKVIVFVLGGATFSELRSVYEVTKKSGHEVIIGTDICIRIANISIGANSVITPKEFVANLRALKKGEDMEK